MAAETKGKQISYEQCEAWVIICIKHFESFSIKILFLIESALDGKIKGSAIEIN